MHKKIQDIVIPKKSIRNIAIPEHKKTFLEIEPEPVQRKKEEDKDQPNIIKVHKEKIEKHDLEKELKKHTSYKRPDIQKSKLKYLLLIPATILIFFIFYFLLGKFNEVIVYINPRQETVQINNSFSAHSAPGSEVLSYNVVTINEEMIENVDPTGEKTGESQSRGRVVIYNNYSKASQRLVRNTRLETQDGLIYKIIDSVTIPGKTVANGKDVAGSIEVDALAESPGPDYNIGLADFTIPGFKSDPEKYKNFYARSKTKMTGGYSGLIKIVSDEKTTEVRNRLQTQLKDELIKKVKSQTPENFITFNNAQFFEFASDDPILNGSTFTIKQSATVYALIFKKDDIMSIIAKSNIKNYDGLPIEMPDIQNANFELVTKQDKKSQENLTPIWKRDVIDFTLKGKTETLWKTDEDAFKKDLVGKNRSELNSVVSKYKGIKNIQVVIKPFWLQTFPDDPQKIKFQGGTYNN
ncbi:MAG: hypothetical protein WCW87_02365 [Candidatus Paceibacterota bacterium]